MRADEVRQLACDWLRYAREDLIAAESFPAGQPGGPRHQAFLAQQAAEKAIKAVLVAEQIEFPFTHDLDELRNLAPTTSALHETCPDLADLSQWAVRTRYPTFVAPTEQEAADARRVATEVVRVAEEELAVEEDE